MLTSKPLELVKSTDPILKKRMPDFDFDKPPTDPVELAEALCAFLKTHKALGLAANQVGLPYRVFVTINELVFFNPIIVDDNSEPVMLEEGCLSFPNMFVNIKRPRYIKIRATNQHGQTDTVKFDGITARVLLHEVDHLNGITMHDKASTYHWMQALNEKKKRDRRAKNAT